MKWKCENCNIELELKDNKAPCFCPHCGQKQSALECISGMEDSETYPIWLSPAAEKIDEEKYVCPICCSEISSQEEQIACPDCNVHYHKECWEENRGCATYGCPSSPAKDEQKEINKGDWRACPWCHTLLPSKTVICSSCGHRIDEIPNVSPTGEESSQFQEGLAKGLRTICYCLLLLWRECIPLILNVFRRYKRAIVKYATFDGEDSRKEFSSFALVHFLASWILIAIPGNLVLAILYWLLTILPTTACIVRRLKNAGMSPWYCSAVPLLLLLLFVPPHDSKILPKLSINSHQPIGVQNESEMH